MKTQILAYKDKDAIIKAAHFIQQGELVGFGTETVYGLGANAYHHQAVAKIYEVKGRPQFNPLIVHIDSMKRMEDFIEIRDDKMFNLMQACWPGPLTFILPLKKDHPISSLVTAGLSTIGVRMPALPEARAFIAAANCPIAAPSANISGKLSPTMAHHVAHDLDGKIPLILDGGAAKTGLESTIIDISHIDHPQLLRLGTQDLQPIEAILGKKLALPTNNITGKVTSPGQLLNHYAPRNPIRINALAPLPGEAWLTIGSDDPYFEHPNSLNLSKAGNMLEAAANLFKHLHELDHMKGIKAIAVTHIKAKGLDATQSIIAKAINERLARAANG